jgi:hypothetical protein
MRRALVLVTLAALALAFAPSASAALILGEPILFSNPGTIAYDYVDLDVGPSGPAPSTVNLEVTATDPAILAWVEQYRAYDTRFIFDVHVPPGTTYGTYAYTVRGVAGSASVGIVHLLVTVGDALDRPVFAAHWERNNLLGGIDLTGGVPVTGNLDAQIQGPGGASPINVTYPLAAGHYKHFIKLPPGSLPGIYVVEQTVTQVGNATDTTVPPYTQRWSVRLAGPSQGYVDRQWISRVEYGEPSAKIAAGARALYVTFHFLSRPAVDDVTTTWYAPNGSATRSVPKHGGSSFVRGFLHSSGALPAGRWRCVLRVAGVTVAEADARIG